ncbi:MAG: hypothetical protein JNG89_17215 [Planctomycetaceae bacterium]|nr:hypothetical protein [Planctomycetaceae bacterium]
MCRKPTLGLALVGAMFSGMLNVATTGAAETNVPAIVTRSHDSGDGQTYLAVSLRSDVVARQATPHDHVVLVDTSASQVGEHRVQAFQVVRDMLTALPANDRVAVFAVDLLAEPLTRGLVTPRDALTAAMPQLERRVPAGSTDMLGALRAALKLFDGPRPTSIVYVGDGMSTANLLQPADLRTVLGELRQRQTPVHSFAVGSATDLQLLGALAQHTGGVVMIDDQNGQNFGTELARSIDLPVIYPTSLKVADRAIQLLPNEPLPLRSDRDTVYIGRGEISRNSQITLTATIDGRSRDLSWAIPPAKYQQANGFLVPLWNKAQQTNGLSNGLAGETMVVAAQQAFVDVSAALESSAEAAVTEGRTADAEQLESQLEAFDPSARTETAEVLAQAEPATPPAPGLEPREQPRAATAVDQAAELMDVQTQQLQSSVNSAITESRKILRTEPEAAQSLLEDELRIVKSATSIDPDAKNELIRVLGNELAAVNGQIEVVHMAQREAQRRTAVQQAQQRLLDAQMQENQRTRELVDRIRSLMIEGFEGNPDAFEEAEAVSRVLASMQPGSAIGVQEVFQTEAAGHFDKALRLRLLRSDRFLATLHQVELSHVPFPDEPPLRYPPAEVWQALTEKRQKWKSVDLHQNSANEERIYNALDSSTNIEFSGTPLRDVISYISELHDIPILLDMPALSEEGITGDEEVSLVVNGIKLRSGLKLLLEDVNQVELAYVIEDEVMKITTKDEADNTLQTRVYPVADLVIQPRVMGGGGSGMGGGGIFGGGGMGGGMGGMGGGMGGMGGGMGGMGGGMGGGGFFSLPDPEAQPAQPQVFDAGAINQLKKKPGGVK